MKRLYICLALISLLTLMSAEGHSQDYLSDISRDVKTIYFKGDNANHKITVGVLPGIDETFRVSIPLYNEDAFFIILENKIVPFRNWLQFISNKFSEWRSVAINNNVTSVFKKIDLTSPGILCTGHSEGHLIRAEDVALSASFEVKDGISHMRIESWITDGIRWDVLYLDFYNESEFKELISSLDYNHLEELSNSIIQDYFKKQRDKEGIEELFK